ncbi:MAG: GAF domain-containing sensor histidine kinase [Roseiflexaceae bacterium]
MSDLSPNNQARENRQRDRQVRYFATLKVIAETLNNGVSLRQTFESTLPLVIELLQLHTGWLFLFDQGSFTNVASYQLPPALAYPGSAWDDPCECQRLARSGDLHAAAQVVECSRLRDATGDRQGLAYHASVPLVKGDRLLGIMNVATPQWDVFTPQDIEILSAIGHQIATAIERTQLAEQATRVALVEERNRLAREVHDTLAQELTGIALQLEAADALLEHSPERARARIRQALERTRESLAEARRSVLDLRAGPLERQALPAALETLSQRFTAETGTPVTSQLALVGPRLPARVEEALYRIAQEALVNIRRHAQADMVRIELRQTGDSVQLIVADNGRGFDIEQTSAPGASAHAHGFGLIGMQERAHLLNGRMQISSCPGAGAQVEVTIPLG